MANQSQSAADATEDVLVTLRVPRSALAAAAPLPEYVTQHTVRELVGIEPRAFLAIVRSPNCPLAVVRLGRSRAVRREELLAHLASIATAPSASPAVAIEAAELSRRPSLAEQLGLEVAPGPGARRGDRGKLRRAG